MDKPAILGGKPVREGKIEVHGIGVSLYDYNEIANVKAVIEEKSPFRYYGPNVLGMAERFEQLFANYIGVKYALAVSSGSAALHIALAALDIGLGDEVLVTPLSWISDGFAPIWVNAKPVFIDIDYHTLNISPKEIEKNISEKTKAIIVVHYLGYPANMDEIIEVAEKHGLYIIEDASHAHGAKYKDKMIGSIGDIGVFSCQLHKIITSGEGGILTFKDEEIYEKAYRFHDLGMFMHKPPFKSIGFQYRITEVQAALLYTQFNKIDFILSRLRENGKYLEKRLDEELKEYIRYRVEEPDIRQTYYSFPIEIKWERLKIDIQYFIKAMLSEGIPVGRINMPMYNYNAFFNKCIVPYSNGKCINAEKAYDRWITLPTAPNIFKEDLDDIVNALKKVLNYFTKQL